MKNKLEFCFICGRTQEDHKDMDHDIRTQAESRARYEKILADNIAAERKILRRADGTEARRDLRSSVKELTTAHFRAGNLTLIDELRDKACVQFTLSLDDAHEALDTLEETLGA